MYDRQMQRKLEHKFAPPIKGFNIHKHMYRLIVITLIRNNFDIKAAHKINAPHMEYEAYKTMIFRYGVKIRSLMTLTKNYAEKHSGQPAKQHRRQIVIGATVREQSVHARA